MQGVGVSSGCLISRRRADMLLGGLTDQCVAIIFHAVDVVLRLLVEPVVAGDAMLCRVAARRQRGMPHGGKRR